VIGTEGASSAAEQDEEQARFAEELLAGLSRPRKVTHPKWLYDARGSALYEQICEQPEYYPPRLEKALLRAHARELADAIGSDALVFEYGAGSGVKTALLLGALRRPAAWVPVDISREALGDAAERMQARFPGLRIRPVAADFTAPFALPVADLPCARRVAFFPGSTIGNFDPAEAVTLLRRMARDAGEGGRLVIGVDHPKEEAALVAAYDDARGITAAFDLNLLVRANRELDADFGVDAFRHRAVWDPRRSRIEMLLESLDPQQARVLDRTFRFDAGETIHTESAYKWEPRAFDALAALAGWRPEAAWTDDRAWFGVRLYRVA
jgi:dimethylhistidine N-methyltransferase